MTQAILCIFFQIPYPFKFVPLLPYLKRCLFPLLCLIFPRVWIFFLSFRSNSPSPLPLCASLLKNPSRIHNPGGFKGFQRKILILFPTRALLRIDYQCRSVNRPQVWVQAISRERVLFRIKWCCLRSCLTRTIYSLFLCICQRRKIEKLFLGFWLFSSARHYTLRNVSSR
jgi:hypothetical protein